MVHKTLRWKERDFDIMAETFIHNLGSDAGMMSNDVMVENLEDEFHVDLTGLYGEEDPKRFRKAMKWLEGGAKGNNQFLSEAE